MNKLVFIALGLAAMTALPVHADNATLHEPKRISSFQVGVERLADWRAEPAGILAAPKRPRNTGDRSS